ncbi:MAG: hypothetical protein IT331_16745 [Anaerolineae bacterium]|nr:hypothetical protein [Anaerolineae bacterium]
MEQFALSINGVPIRLTDERWNHIAQEHGELGDLQRTVLETVSNPERILDGGQGELLAVSQIEQGKWLIVVYRQGLADGFIITAFFTRRYSSLRRRNQVWP